MPAQRSLPADASTDLDASLLFSRLRRTQVVRLVRRALPATWPGRQRVLVACSGGPDSTALMLSIALLRESQSLVPHVVCIDHQLRPAAAQEAQQVVAVAQRLGLSAQILPVEVAAGPSRQAQARNARYQALVLLAEQLDAPWILLGHTRDDQAETMLMRWLAGAGPKGLAGMSEVAQPPCAWPSFVRLVRPLLAVSRAQIQGFLRQATPIIAPLPIDDPSNADPRYLRSRLRSEALPILRRLAPHLDAHLLDLSQQLARDAALLDELAAQALQTLLRPPASARSPAPSRDDRLALPVRELAALPGALTARIFRRLLGSQLGARHVTALLSLCASTAGRKWLDLPGCGRIERSRGWLLLPRLSPAARTMQASATPDYLGAQTHAQDPPALDGWEADA